MSANRLKLNPDKTKLLWTGTRSSLSRLVGSRPKLVLGTEVIDASGSPCLHGVTFMPDLFGKARIHCQWKVFLPATSVAMCMTLTRLGCGINVHIFVVISRVDYCNCAGGIIQEVGRQTPTCHERRRPHINTEEEVRQGDDSNTP